MRMDLVERQTTTVVRHPWEVSRANFLFGFLTGLYPQRNLNGGSMSELGTPGSPRSFYVRGPEERARHPRLGIATTPKRT